MWSNLWDSSQVSYVLNLHRNKFDESACEAAPVLVVMFKVWNFVSCNILNSNIS